MKNTNKWRLNNMLQNKQQITRVSKMKSKYAQMQKKKKERNESATTPNLWDSV